MDIARGTYSSAFGLVGACVAPSGYNSNYCHT